MGTKESDAIDTTCRRRQKFGQADLRAAGPVVPRDTGDTEGDLHPAGAALSFGRGAVKWARTLAGACPYTMLAGVLIRWGRLILGFKDAQRAVKKRTLLSGVVIGRNLALLGLFCPIFWVSLFSGASAAAIRFNAIHSACFVMIGLIWMAISLIRIELSNGDRARCTSGRSGHKKS